jgi:1-acyl-sn-glycerol-3-phosphate acyltransferase
VLRFEVRGLERLERGGLLILANHPTLIDTVFLMAFVKNADCIASLQRGNNLIVFPEGTRTPGDGVIRMKRGAANIAVRGGRTMTPVLIRCAPAALGKGTKWWRVPSRRVLIEIDVQADLDIGTFTGGGVSDVIATRHSTEFLQDYFSEKCQRHA